jgi:hypothetical protein
MFPLSYERGTRLPQRVHAARAGCLAQAALEEFDLIGRRIDQGLNRERDSREPIPENV